MNFKRQLLYLVILLPILDRLSKWLIINYQEFYKSSWLDLSFFANKNFYFLKLDSAFNIGFFYFLSIAAIFSLLFAFWKLRHKNYSPGILFIIAGGLSNLFDRLFFGYVVDWMRIFVLPISVFNVADIMIFFGFLIIIAGIFKKK